MIEKRVLQDGLGAVFYGKEPDPWMIKVGAEEIHLPDHMHPRMDPVPARGNATPTWECFEGGTYALSNKISLQLLEFVPDVYWSLKKFVHVVGSKRGNLRLSSVREGEFYSCRRFERAKFMHVVGWKG